MRSIVRSLMCFSLLVMVCVSVTTAQTPPSFGIISTYAGGGPNNLPASSAGLNYVSGIAFDSDTFAQITLPAGNLYIASQHDHRVFKVDTSGNLTLFAGAGWCGYSGDNGPATTAALCYPNAIAVDASGNVYIADLNRVVRKVDTTGTITTYAGSGSSTYSGDGRATAVGLCSVLSLATAGTNLYIGSSCSRIFAVDTTGALTTIAGNGTNGYSGDGGPALLASISQPKALAVNAPGNVYFADANNYRIRKIDTNAKITTVVGTGVKGYNSCQSSSTALSTPISNVLSLVVDDWNDLFYEDQGSYCVLRFSLGGGYVSPAAGTGASYTGSALGATAGTTALSYVYDGLQADGLGNLYIADYNRQQILKVAPVSGNVYYGPVSVLPATGRPRLRATTSLRPRPN